MDNKQVKNLKNSILLNIDTNILDQNNLIKKNKLSKEITKQLFVNLFIKVDCKVNYEVLQDNNIIVDFGNNTIKFLDDENLKKWQLIDKFKNLIRHNSDIVNCKLDQRTNNLDYYFSFGNNLRNKLNINIDLSLFCKKYFNLFMSYLNDIESINNRQDNRKIISNVLDNYCNEIMEYLNNSFKDNKDFSIALTHNISNNLNYKLQYHLNLEIKSLFKNEKYHNYFTSYFWLCKNDNNQYYLTFNSISLNDNIKYISNESINTLKNNYLAVEFILTNLNKIQAIIKEKMINNIELQNLINSLVKE